MSIIGTIVGYGAKGIGTGISVASVVPRTVGKGMIFVGTKIVEASDAMEAFGDGIAESGDIGLWGDKNVNSENYDAFCVLHPDIAAQGPDAVVKAMYAEAKKGEGAGTGETVGTGRRPVTGDPGRVGPDSGTVIAEVVEPETGTGRSTVTPKRERVVIVEAEAEVKAEQPQPVKQPAQEQEEIPPHVLAAELC